ncbi:hypothetical protein BDF21DRAFT_400623 [Thamnidium elegans]|nr:hypothetical protein BDF21DRAFT_400623 [Thamnidium elegans]
MQQNPTLKSLTQSLHFNVPLTDETLLEFAITCPRIHTLTLFVNLLNNLSIPKTVSVINTYWARTLIKIRMDELLLPQVLPLLCHQLQDVTGSWGSLLDTDRSLIAMPKLLILDVDNDDEYELTIPVLDQMRVAYPSLKKLTASYFNLKREDHTPLVPFPLVRSFHLLNSNDLDCGLRHIMNMFRDLKEYSVIRSYVSDTSTEDRNKLFKDLALVHPRIHDLKLDLFTDLTLYSCFTRITSLQLEAIPEEDIISHRVSVDLIKLVSRLPGLKHFKLYGIVHLESNEPLNHYLLNTYQSGCTLTDQLEDDEEEEEREDENDLFEISTDDIHYSRRELYKNILVNKILPKTPIWNIQPNLSTYNNDPSSATNVISKLVSLNIEMATLRNPTFHWLKHNCPLLQELHVLKTEPYPYAAIELGPNVHTFTLSFNRRVHDTNLRFYIIFVKYQVQFKLLSFNTYTPRNDDLVAGVSCFLFTSASKNFNFCEEYQVTNLLKGRY